MNRYGDREGRWRERGFDRERDFDRDWERPRSAYGRDFERERWHGEPRGRYEEQPGRFEAIRGRYGPQDYDYEDYEPYHYGYSDWWDEELYDPYYYGQSRSWDWWEVPGPYQGVGPRGYSRTDEAIWEDIADRLTWHGHIDAREIEIEVEDGEVTLKGSVNTRREKRLAEDIAFDVLGVADIHNRLRVRHPKRTADRRMERFANRLTRGMKVVGSNGKDAGKVVDILGYDFMLERPDGERFYIPFNALESVDDKAELSVPEDQIEEQGWQTIEMTEPETGATS
jgi:hypothetical protein